jgi:hypothetical protein
MGCKWVFVVKQKPDVAIKRFKARLVVKCFTQTFDIDYQITFAPIAKMNSLRVLFILCCKFGMGFTTIRCKKCLFTWRFGKKKFARRYTWFRLQKDREKFVN